MRRLWNFRLIHQVQKKGLIDFMSTKNIKQWIKKAGIRAVKTVAQTAVATIGVSATMGQVDWLVVGSTALLSGILSLLTSVAGLPEIDDDDEKEEVNK